MHPRFRGPRPFSPQGQNRFSVEVSQIHRHRYCHQEYFRQDVSAVCSRFRSVLPVLSVRRRTESLSFYTEWSRSNHASSLPAQTIPLRRVFFHTANTRSRTVPRGSAVNSCVPVFPRAVRISFKPPHCNFRGTHTPHRCHRVLPSAG